MKNNILLLICLFGFKFSFIAQEKASSKTKNEVMITSLKPLDERGAVFSSQEELDAKVADKKNGIILLIKENTNDLEKVKMYREELWRFENATVQPPRSN